MSHVWRGRIDLGPHGPPIDGLSFEGSPCTATSTLITVDTLRYLSIIRTSAVPLYVVAGPALAVGNHAAQARARLLGLLGLGCEAKTEASSVHPPLICDGQSEFGILFSVQTESSSQSHAVTEYLVYAMAEWDRPSLPSPPASSSPIASDTGNDSLPPPHQNGKYRLHALPLCSKVLQRAREASGLCTPPPESEAAFFIPDNLSELEAAMRRRKMSSVFDAASQKRRKSKAKGGENISRAMASLERANSQHHIKGTTRTSEIDQEQTSRVNLIRSTSENHASLEQDSQQLSRAVGLPEGRSSSLYHTEAMGTDSGLPSGPKNGILEQNKAALSKMIMAGMRLYGLQQRRKATKPEAHSNQMAQVSLPDVTMNAGGDDEYKQVYHQTLKSAIFACRRHCNDQVLSQDSMRDLVDRLLAIFCCDPLHVQGFGLLQTPGFSSIGHEKDNPFDAPSSSAARAAINVFDTPVHKKRKRLDRLESG